MRKVHNMNNEILRQMRKIYYDKEHEYIDSMGYKITLENKPSYHHIVKAENLKENNEDYTATIDNGAYLGKISHDLLHVIEKLDIDLYHTWNNLFLLINKSRKYPTEEMWSMIYSLQEKTNEKILEYKNTKKR